MALRNDHDLTIAHPPVALLSSDDLLPQDEENEDDDETNGTKEIITDKYCLSCWRLARSHVPLKSEAEVAYHMKGK
jgi:hypothetical protein